MQLAPLRFTKIEGTTVAVNVASAEEAKAAVKELRHKKRELKFLRGALAKQQLKRPSPSAHEEEQAGQGRVRYLPRRHALGHLVTAGSSA